MTKALYTGSFDPFTYGHLDIVERALKTFDYVTVGVADNPSKKYMFSKEEKINIVIRALSNKGINNVDVVSINGLVADYAAIHGFTHVLKGVRSSEDFSYEKVINDVSLTQRENFETILMFSRPKFTHISSSAVKELSKNQGIIHEYVPLFVKAAMEEKAGQTIIGVTGIIGSGKSTLCKKAAELYGVHYIDLDKIGHELFRTDPERLPISDIVQTKLKTRFGTFDRKELGEIVFNSKEKLNFLNEVMREPILTLLRAKLSDLKGIILIEGALLLEMGWSFLCNNRVILMTPPNRELLFDRLRLRGMKDDQIERRLNSQFSHEIKNEIIKNTISKDKFGWVEHVNFNYRDNEIPSILKTVINNSRWQD